jgi:hypothetical protein
VQRGESADGSVICPEPSLDGKTSEIETTRVGGWLDFSAARRSRAPACGP